MENAPPALRGELVLYMRPGCHVCAEGESLLTPLLAAVGRTVRHVDVALDPAAEARYGERVPVLTCDGRELCWGRFDPAVLAALFGQSVVRARRSRWPRR